jgi:hypothetical protein
MPRMYSGRVRPMGTFAGLFEFQCVNKRVHPAQSVGGRANAATQGLPGGPETRTPSL